MSEQLAGEAGVAQHVPELLQEQQPAQAQFEGSNLFDRLRNKWATIVATGAAAMALATSPVSEQPVYAASTSQAVLGMPFEGKWAYPISTTAGCGPNANETSHPSCHAINSGDWSTDLYAAAGTDVKLKVDSPGALSFAWEAATGSCGETRRVKVFADNEYLGRVHFTHLSDAAPTQNSPTNGMVIGKIANLACNPGGTGKHVHMEVDNADTDTFSCFVNHSTPTQSAGQSLAEGDNLGVLGSTNNGTKQACAEVPNGTKVVPLAGNWVGASNQDLLYITKQGGTGGGSDFGLWESRPTGIVWHSRGAQPSIKFDEAKFIPNDMDGDGLTDMLYATPKKDAQGNNLPKGFDVGYLRNDGNQFVYGGAVWNEPNLKLSEITFLPGNWSGDNKGDIAYVTPNKQFTPQRGIDVAVRRSIGSALVWDGLWWPDQNLKYATTKYIPTDIDGNGKLDLLYASEHSGGGFDIGLQANTGSGFQWAGHQWYSGPSMDLKTTRFIPGNWADPTRQGFAYVTKRQGSENGFDLAVMDMTPSGMVWRGIWWPNATLNYQDVKFMPADVDGNGYSDLFYASSWQPPHTTGFDMALQANTGGNGLAWVGHQWNPNNLKLKDTKFLPSY